MSIITKVIDLSKFPQCIIDSFVESRTDLFIIDDEGHAHMTNKLIEYRDEYSKKYNRESSVLINSFPEQQILDINVFLKEE